MSFYVFFVCGFLGGILGGMGMGGGTVLIPLLTIFCGVVQSVAQGVNLVSFLPMSAVALSVHAKNGLLKKEGLLEIVVPAVLFSVLASFAAVRLSPAVLKKGFGAFLVVLSFFQFASAKKLSPPQKRKPLSRG